MRLFSVRRERKQRICKFKKSTTQGHRRLAELFPYVVTFLIDKVVASVRVAQNETPTMAKTVRFY